MGDDLNVQSTTPWPSHIKELNLEEIDRLLFSNECQDAFEMSEFQEILKEGGFEFFEEFVQMEKGLNTEKSVTESESEENLSQSASSSPGTSSSSEEVSHLDNPPTLVHQFSANGNIPTLSVEYACEFNCNTKHAVQLVFTCGPQCQNQAQNSVQPCIFSTTGGGRGRVVPTSCHGRGDKDILQKTSMTKPKKKKRKKKVWTTTESCESSSRVLRSKTIPPKKPQERPMSKYMQQKYQGKLVSKSKNKPRKQSYTPPPVILKEMLLCKKFGIRKECKVSLTRLTFKLSNTTIEPNNQGVIIGV